MRERFLRWRNSFRNKRKDYFIGDYLNETSDVFEKATIELTYNFIRFILLMEIFYFQMISKKHLYYHYTVNSISMVLLILLLFLLKKSKNVMLVTKLTLLVFTLNCFTIFILQEYQIEVFEILFITATILFAYITLGKKYGSVIFFISLVELYLFGTNEHEAGRFIFIHIPSDQKIVQNLLLIFPPLTLNVYLISKFVETKTSAEAQIIVQKILLEEKNKDITDSIDYAKTIQKAILPSPELKNQLFKNSFILFKPKDIVSGDFYWFTEKDGKKIIAACDCTGHGVPGALMSMVGNNILNQIVNEKGITAPNEILNHLHKEVRKCLKQAEQNETKDGMDIALITFNSELEIEFSGAQRPLWIVRSSEKGEDKNHPPATTQAITPPFSNAQPIAQGGLQSELPNLKSQLTEIKGDKFSIGGLQSEAERIFTNHKISLSKGDCIYIYSDGFADQFSDTDNKLMKSGFKELLLSIQQKSMPEQEVFLSDFIEKWRGKREQIDDILVIGLRI